jgi:hypothetical protein
MSDLNYTKTRAGATTSYKEKASYKISGAAAMVNFSYHDPSIEAENLFDGKVAYEKYLFDRALTLNCYARAISSTRARFGTQLLDSVGGSLKLPFPNFSGIDASFASGVRNSRMDEDYEEDIDYDYHFEEFNISTEHPIADNLSASPFYSAFAKTYTGGSYDSAGYTAGAALKWRPFENFHTRADYYYRQKRYFEMDSLTHFKNKYSISATYRIRLGWGITGKISEGYYEFPFSDSKDRIDSSISIKIDKYLAKNLQAYINGEYRINDYFYASDLNLSKWMLGADYKW